MRLTVAWANVISENMALKIALGCFALVLVGMSITVVRLAGRKPLLVERSCYSKMLDISNGDRTSSEVETFVREALPMRFDTTGQVKPTYLSPDEEKFRVQEQQDFKKRDIAQKITINNVKVSGEKVIVDADRIFTVGSVRSAIAFPLTLSVGSSTRTEWNPYGLTLIQISAPTLDTKSTGDKNEKSK